MKCVALSSNVARFFPTEIQKFVDENTKLADSLIKPTIIAGRGVIELTEKQKAHNKEIQEQIGLNDAIIKQLREAQKLAANTNVNQGAVTLSQGDGAGTGEDDPTGGGKKDPIKQAQDLSEQAKQLALSTEQYILQTRIAHAATGRNSLHFKSKLKLLDLTNVLSGQRNTKQLRKPLKTVIVWRRNA